MLDSAFFRLLSYNSMLKCSLVLVASAKMHRVSLPVIVHLEEILNLISTGAHIL